ncbi:Protein of uncharacterised function (DUF1557) [Moraxella atlantae]|uniref:Protein of uncharacterized function (DUF1557) n=1 Tax=Faucicola atlantae TaxID=34059 RepID=A0A378QLF1_9GAMM|nr:Protein of uncharacterised function (DUF1557) [Moraxella atlantae]
MKLVDRNNELLTVVSQIKLEKTDTVYNITVDDFHTYHVGEFGTWVHNTCAANALNGYIGKKLTYGSNVITIDKEGMQHILERHHPKYFVGDTTTVQTYFDKNMTVDDIQNAITAVLGQNAAKLRAGQVTGQLTGVYNGKSYTVGLRNDRGLARVGQFFPNP